MECLFNCESNNCCAYCKHHHASMTVRQMKVKECLQKECRHLVKNTEHQYWRQRERAKQNKKLKKKMLNNYIMSLNGGV